MDLPRFTSGAVGKLTFAHLNEAFDAIDDLARDGGESTSRAPVKSRLILAKLISESALNPGDWSWTEVARDGANTVAKPNGRSSSTAQSAFAYPIRSDTGDALAANDVVLAAPMRDADGLLYYAAAQPFARGIVTEPIVIVSSSAVTAGVQWLYTVRRVANTAYTFPSSPPDFEALNGAENRIDGGGVYGVGFGGGAASSLTRRPIEPGVVVLGVKVSPTRYVFSIPNGYGVNC
jgi:hypothetical protein